MLISQTSTKSNLANKIANIKRLRILVKEMKKPENFTYVDVLDLHNCLSELEQYLSTFVEEQKNSNETRST